MCQQQNRAHSTFFSVYLDKKHPNTTRTFAFLAFVLDCALQWYGQILREFDERNVGGYISLSHTHTLSLSLSASNRELSGTAFDCWDRDTQITRRRVRFQFFFSSGSGFLEQPSWNRDPSRKWVRYFRRGTMRTVVNNAGARGLFFLTKFIVHSSPSAVKREESSSTSICLRELGTNLILETVEQLS